MPDPRRVIVTFRANSYPPRARRWYRVAEVCELDGKLFLHRDFVAGASHEINGASPTNRADAVRAARGHSDATGFPYVPGQRSVIAAAGRNSLAKGVEGTWIALAEYDDDGECIGFATGKVRAALNALRAAISKAEGE